MDARNWEKPEKMLTPQQSAKNKTFRIMISYLKERKVYLFLDRRNTQYLQKYETNSYFKLTTFF